MQKSYCLNKPEYKSVLVSEDDFFHFFFSCLEKRSPCSVKQFSLKYRIRSGEQNQLDVILRLNCPVNKKLRRLLVAPLGIQTCCFCLDVCGAISEMTVERNHLKEQQSKSFSISLLYGGQSFLLMLNPKSTNILPTRQPFLGLYHR